MENEEKFPEGVEAVEERGGDTVSGDSSPFRDEVTVETLKALYQDIDPDMLLADGLDDALIGVAVKDGGKQVALYDIAECISIFVRRDKMGLEQALEFFEFNVANAYVGEKGPVFAAVYRRPYVFEQGDTGLRAFTESNERREEQLQLLDGDERNHRLQSGS